MLVGVTKVNTKQNQSDKLTLLQVTVENKGMSPVISNVLKTEVPVRNIYINILIFQLLQEYTFG